MSLLSHLKDHGADQCVDRPGEGFGDTGSLKTPQHYPPFAEDGEEIKHLATTDLDLKHTHGGGKRVRPEPCGE